MARELHACRAWTIAVKTVVYASVKTPKTLADPSEAVDIVERAQLRNLHENVTGALLATSEHFAQVLEGPPEGVDAIISSILRDPRHTEIAILRDGPIQRRSFAKWSLAYIGEATYVGGMVQAAHRQPTEPTYADRLMRLMREFVRSEPGLSRA